MFIPGEAFFAAAVEQDPNLFDDALSQGVLITTPTTLIGLAKAIAYGWRQEQVAKDALELSKLGGELYNSMATMAEHVEKLGRNLGNSVDSYNKFVGSLDRNVLSKGRRLKSYQVQQGKKDIPETVNEVLQSPRHWTAPTDMEPIAGAVDSGAVSSGAPAQDQLADTSAPIAESNTPEDPMF
jgi:DNA recombination protein RmuC